MHVLHGAIDVHAVDTQSVPLRQPHTLTLVRGDITRQDVEAVVTAANTGPQDAATLASAYTQSLARADEVGATSVAFPSISSGAYGYPLAEAATVSIQALCGAVTAIQSVLLVAFSSQVQELWKQALEG